MNKPHDVQCTQIGRLRCSIADTNNASIFFSLVDYRNNLFTSNDPKKIMEFYDGFDNRDQLIQWMRERPKGVSYIREFDGDKDIIVVIPTADYNGKYARECRENIFKGLHIIFVESGGRDDFYFNYAHNCNLGIKKAMEYNPKWIVLSNDDMYKRDEVDVLINELKNTDNSKIMMCYVKLIEATNRVAKQQGIIGSNFRIIRILLSYVIPDLRKKILIEKKLKIFYARYLNNFVNRLYIKKLFYFYGFGPIGIFSSYFIKQRPNFKLFDETFINASEDVDLSIETSQMVSEGKVNFLNYKIGSFRGSSLGRSIARGFRDESSAAYFNYKLENKFYNSKGL